MQNERKKLTSIQGDKSYAKNTVKFEQETKEIGESKEQHAQATISQPHHILSTRIRQKKLSEQEQHPQHPQATVSELHHIVPYRTAQTGTLCWIILYLPQLKPFFSLLLTPLPSTCTFTTETRPFFPIS